MIDLREQLMRKFHIYQAVLADENEGDKIDLEKISSDYCILSSEEGGVSIRCISARSDSVYMSIKDKDLLFPLSVISDDFLEELVEVMRKSMIINELRNSYKAWTVVGN